MKTSFRILPFATMLTVALLSQPAPAAPTLPELQIVERGPHHRVWERQNVRTLPNGRIITNRSSFVELESGMHVLRDGRFTESREEIELFQDGAIARNGPHQVIWAPNINTAGAIDLLTPDGQRLRSHVLGIGIHDAATGQSELLAEVKDSIGQLNPPNEIFYLDAFDGVLADLRYSYRKGAFVQDVIVRENIALPPGYNPATTRLEVWTEFIEAPEPRKRERMRGGMPDQTLEFDSMYIGPGKAFLLGDDPDSNRAAVSKRWIQIEGRTFLIEAVQITSLKRGLDRLPAPKQQAGLRKPGRALMAKVGDDNRLFPAAREVRKDPKAKMRLAALSPRNIGLVLDYDLAASGGSFVFKGNTTYYVSGSVTFSGNVTFEGGTVIKFANTNSSKVKVTGTIDWQGGAYHPVVLTARDDHSIGEAIGSSALSGYYAAIALEVDPTSVVSLKNLRISHAAVGLSLHDQTFEVKHAQFVRCQTAIEGNKPTVYLGNALIYDCNKAFDLTQSLVIGEHATFHQLSTLASTASGSTLDLTNSLLIQVTNIGSNFSAGFVQTNATAANVFDVVGAGASYLKSSSSYRNVGTPNINATLLADIKKRTTYPPIVIGDGTFFTTSLTLYPQAQRDTDTPDLGYHYDCLDYVFSALALTNATITAMPGVAIGTRTLNSYGLGLLGGAKFFCEGTPANLNRIVRYNTVQEQANTSWADYTSGGANIMTAWATTSTAPQARIRFTEFSVPAGTELYHVWGMAEDAGTHDFRDCQFHAGIFWSDRPTVGVTNGLFNRTKIALLENYDMNPIFRHCTFVGSDLQLAHVGSTAWTFKDNLFDATTVSYAEGNFTNNYNAYTTNATRLTPNGANDVRLSVTNIAYDTGWLGRFYLPTNLTSHSTLFNSGITNANLLGFYHYTVVTNQTRELTGVIDLGFHYVAVNSSGQPIDTDGDGSPDYFEDLDGDGTADSGETDWQTYNSIFGIGSGPGLVLFTPLK